MCELSTVCCLRVCEGSGARKSWKEIWVLGSSQLYYFSHVRKISVPSSHKISPAYLKLAAQGQGHLCTLYNPKEWNGGHKGSFFFSFHFIELSKKNSPGNIQPTKLDYFTSTERSYCKFHSTLIKPFLKYISRINAKLS